MANLCRARQLEKEIECLSYKETIICVAQAFYLLNEEGCDENTKTEARKSLEQARLRYPKKSRCGQLKKDASLYRSCTSSQFDLRYRAYKAEIRTTKKRLKQIVLKLQPKTLEDGKEDIV